MILQTEAAECGTACLAMVASAHGRRVDLPALRRMFAPSARGTSLAVLLRMAEALGLQGRALRAEPAHLPRLTLPCILHWDLNHFVVLVRTHGEGATIHDPAQGRRRVSAAELSAHFTGVAMELTPSPAFEPGNDRRRVRLAQLVGPVPGLARTLAQVFALALALEVLVLVSPFFVQWVVDDVLAGGDRALLRQLGIGFALLVVLQASVAVARSWTVMSLAARLNARWAARLFAHLLSLPMAWFERRHAGDIWSRFGAVHHIQRTLTTGFVEAVLDGLLVVLTLAAMLAYSPWLAAVASAAVVVYLVSRAASLRPMREASEARLVHEARQATHFLESLRGVRSIKLANAQAQRQSAFASRVIDAVNADVAVQRLQVALGAGHRLLFGLERVGVVWLGALLVMDGSLSVGMLFAFLAYKEQFTQRCSALVDKAVELRMLRLHGERLADIALTPPEPLQAGGAAPMVRSVAPVIELRDVHFRYAEGEPEVLRGVDLRIAPGESLAIVGPSGCGKSTLLKLLLGLQLPTRGEVLLDGVALSDHGVAAWRDRVATVMQDEPLFTGSIADNIAFFDAEPDETRMNECARLAQIDADIEALPMRYETLVGDLGHTLSGGQCQRLLLARALYRRPQVLLLDEATSELDVPCERAITAAIRELPMTRIVVAHRPDTIAGAGRVVALRDGRIVQDLHAVPVPAPSAAPRSGSA